MPDESLDSPPRRKLLASVGAGIVAYGAGVGPTAAQAQEEVQVTLDNVGSSAWEVTNIEGDDELAETGVENPELTLREGVRYTFQNDGYNIHPLAFRTADDEPLLTQSGDGSFEGDSETNWVEDGETVSFTVTGELADELDDYVCTVHGSMNGSISTVQANDSSAPADVTFSDQSGDGTSVTVDSVRLDDGGFVTIHDSTLTDGEALESVRGTSEYLDVGSVQNLEVELDDPITESETLIAMPHRDTNDNETYDFVSSGAEADAPYTAGGNPVTDDADVQVDGSAAVRINDQQSDGASVVVDYVRLDSGGFVTIHDSTLTDGDALGSVRGTSVYLDAGEHEGLEVTLDEPLEATGTLIAMPHQDTNSNQTYDFVSSEGGDDGPYTDDSGPVTDSAEVTTDGSMDGDDGSDMDGDDGSDMDGEDGSDGMDSEDGSDGMDGEDGSDGMDGEDGSDGEDGDDGGDSSDGSGPGFGPVAGAAGLSSLAAYAYRKLDLDSEPATPEDDDLGEDAE